MKSPYTDTIRKITAELGAIGTSPGWVEAWIRVEHGTLDHFSYEELKTEVRTALACIHASNEQDNIDLAASYGFTS